MLITKEQIKEIHDSVESISPLTEAEIVAKREALRKQAMDFLLANQETYVAQWILQNPYAQVNDYRLKFEYNDQSLMGYTVVMEKIDV